MRDTLPQSGAVDAIAAAIAGMAETTVATIAPSMKRRKARWIGVSGRPALALSNRFMSGAFLGCTLTGAGAGAGAGGVGLGCTTGGAGCGAGTGVGCTVGSFTRG